MVLVDTAELKRHTQRKLHAAWQEIHDNFVHATPTVAEELAPEALSTLGTQDISGAELRLQREKAQLGATDAKHLRRQVWWAQMWGNRTSPYRIIKLDSEQSEVARRFRSMVPSRCFPNTDPDEIPDLNDARIVSEAFALARRCC